VAMASMHSRVDCLAGYRATTAARVRHWLRLQLMSQRPAALVYQPLSATPAPPLSPFVAGRQYPLSHRGFSAFLESDSRL
jgi:hypothetical protein